jgi:hypothetical protein
VKAGYGLIKGGKDFVDIRFIVMLPTALFEGGNTETGIFRRFVGINPVIDYRRFFLQSRGPKIKEVMTFFELLQAFPGEGEPDLKAFRLVPDTGSAAGDL